MKVGVCIEFRTMDEMSKKFNTLVENNFDNFQLICWNVELFTKENAEAIAKLAKEHGVTISAFWCGWEGPAEWNFQGGPKTLGLIPLEWRETRVKNLCDGADFAKAMGVQNVVTHMGFIYEDPNHPDYDAFCDAVRRVADHCKANGQNILFETGQETPVAMLRCLRVHVCV